jgi:hypothetical protein
MLLTVPSHQLSLLSSTDTRQPVKRTYQQQVSVAAHETAHQLIHQRVHPTHERRGWHGRANGAGRGTSNHHGAPQLSLGTWNLNLMSFLMQERIHSNQSQQALLELVV